MKAALEDPYNQRFQLVCESTIPVRTPIFTHDQLLAQNMSRIGYPGKMWGDIEGSANRWPLAMYEECPELRHHTKFHRQWITLIRKHAQIVVDDAFLFDLHKGFCNSDEQYIGTLLRHSCR
ncbi:g9109 [Coccomyxa elongata]